MNPLNEYYVPALTFYRTKYNLAIRPASVYIQPYAEKQGDVIRLNIKESYLPPKKIYQLTHSKRSLITEWTDKSRKRLLEKLLKIDLNKQFIYVSLLTYTTKFKEHITPAILQKHRNKLFIYLNRKFPELGIVWKLEYTRRQMPHLHLLLTSKEEINIHYLRWTIAKLWNQVLCKDFNKVVPAGNDYWNTIFKFHNSYKNTQPMKSKGIINYYSSYMTKYKSKEYQNTLPSYLKTDKSMRFWGVVNGKNIITYEVERVELTHYQYLELKQQCVEEIKKRNPYYYNNKYGLTYYLKSDYGDIIDNKFVDLLIENSCDKNLNVNIQQSTNKLKRKQFNDFVYIPEKVKNQKYIYQQLYMF